MNITQGGFLAFVGTLAAAFVPKSLFAELDLDQIPDVIGCEGIGFYCLSGIKIDGLLAMNCAGWRPKTGEVKLESFSSNPDDFDSNGFSYRWIKPEKVEAIWREGHGPDGRPRKCALCSAWRRVYRGVE